MNAPEFFGLDCQAIQAVDMLEFLGGTNSSALLAPWTIMISLIMVYNGAAGTTAFDIRNIIMCDAANRKSARASLHEFMLQGNVDPHYSEFFQPYFQKGVPIAPKYQDLMNKGKIQIEYVDFGKPDAAQQINNYVANATEQKVQKIVDELDPATNFLFLSTQSFKGNWTVEMNESKNATFYVNEHTTKTIPMMQQTSSKFGYYENKYFRGVRISFNNANKSNNCQETNRPGDCTATPELAYHFLIFLPQKRFGLDEVLWRLDGPAIKNVLNANDSKTQVNLTFPSFNFQYSKSLKDALKSIGVKNGFDPKNADFSGISSQKLYLGDFYQVNTIEVNSKGVGAGTGSASKMLPHALPERDSINFEANEPFVYMIVDPKNSMLNYAGIFA